MDETFSYMIICMVLVVGVLWILALATNLMGLPFKLQDSIKAKKQAQAKAEALQIAQVQSAKANEESSKVATLISSAVYATMQGAAHRIISIKPADASNCIGVNPQIAAVISAAVFTALDGQAFRINSIKPTAPDFNWASSGRNAIFASKNPKL